jgi:hypothetical protein
MRGWPVRWLGSAVPPGDGGWASPTGSWCVGWPASAWRGASGRPRRGWSRSRRPHRANAVGTPPPVFPPADRTARLTTTAPPSTTPATAAAATLPDPRRQDLPSDQPHGQRPRQLRLQPHRWPPAVGTRPARCPPTRAEPDRSDGHHRRDRLVRRLPAQRRDHLHHRRCAHRRRRLHRQLNTRPQHPPPPATARTTRALRQIRAFDLGPAPPEVSPSTTEGRRSRRARAGGRLETPRGRVSRRCVSRAPRRSCG